MPRFSLAAIALVLMTLGCGGNAYHGTPAVLTVYKPAEQILAARLAFILPIMQVFGFARSHSCPQFIRYNARNGAFNFDRLRTRSTDLFFHMPHLSFKPYIFASISLVVEPIFDAGGSE